MSVVLYLGTDAGVLTLRMNGSGSWEIEQQALQGWAVQEVAAVPGDPGSVFAATRGDGVWLSRDFGKTWKKPSYGRPGPGKVRCLAFDPKNASRVYAGGEPIEIFVSDDLGANWDRLQSSAICHASRRLIIRCPRSSPMSATSRSTPTIRTSSTPPSR